MFNLPSLPSNINLALFTIGIALCGFSIYSILMETSNSSPELIILGEEEDVIRSEILETNISIKSKTLILENEARILSRENQVENPVRIVGDSMHFSPKLKPSEQEILTYDALFPFLKDLQVDHFKLNQLNLEIMRIKTKINTSNNDSETRSVMYLFLLIGGGILTIVTLRDLISEDLTKQKILAAKLSQDEVFRHCQSCARNFDFEVKFGTEKNNRKSKLFCSDCYSHGEFTDFISVVSFEKYKHDSIKNQKSLKQKNNLKRRFRSLQRWMPDKFYPTE